MIKVRRTMDQLKVWYYRAGSAGSRLSREDIPAERISNARLLHLTGITPALSPEAARAAQHALDVAREAGVLVSFDLIYRAALWSTDDAADVFRNFIARADIVFAGDDEAAIAVGKSDDSLELARRVAVAAAAHQQPLGAHLDVIPRAFLGRRVRSLVSLVGRFVLGEPDVPVGPEDLARPEPRLQFGQQGGDRIPDQGVVAVLVLRPVRQAPMWKQARPATETVTGRTLHHSGRRN